MATAIVAAGAGARGAYEAGVLSRILPKLLNEEKEDKVILLGTSAGAINTAIVAGAADQSPDQIAEKLRATWSGLDVGKIFRLSLRAPFAFGAQALGVPHVHSYALLDTRPLRNTVEHGGYVDWATLPGKFGRSWLKAAAVVATEVSTGKSVVFVQGLDDTNLPAARLSRGIHYRAASLAPDHVLASAAIPIAFPSIALPGGGWFVDGGVRLNTPIAPAIDLLAKVDPGGNNRIIVVSTEPDPRQRNETSSRPLAADRPDILDQAASILYSGLVDRVAEDVLSLRKVNAVVKASATKSLGDTDTAGRSFDVIDHCYFGPTSRGTIASKAGTTYQKGSYPLWTPSGVFNLISHALGNRGMTHDELLSFLFFDREFLSALVEMGQKDADERMRNGHVPWE